MKINCFLIKCLCPLFLVFIAPCCVNKENRIGVEHAEKKNNADSLQAVQETEETLLNISELLTETEKTLNTEIDSNKIYEEKDITRAVCTQSNAETIAFCIDNFKFPNPNPKINGTIWADLIIEKDGSVSDVIIVEGLDPVLDKETIRVMKLMPNFIPGKINGLPVRSKYRMPTSFSYREIE